MNRALADIIQRISILSLYMRFITSSQRSMGKQMLQRVILWFFSMTATATGGLCAW